MLKFKNGKSLEQVADEVLEAYLLRCYATVSKKYTPIINMPPDEGVKYLFKMRNDKKIAIFLESNGDLIECKISQVN